MRKICICALLGWGMMFLGCGGGNTITLPSDKLTPEQEAKVKVEDKSIDDEESQGKKKAKK